MGSVTSDPDLPKSQPVFPHFGWRSPEYTPEGSIHVALIAEPRFHCDAGIRLVGLAQQVGRAFDTEPSGRLREAFSSRTPIR